MATVKDTVRELNEPIKVHYHDGDREPRMTPMALAELVNLHTRALDLINRLDRTIVDSEKLFKRIYEQKGEAETRVAQLEAEKAQLEAERDAAVADINVARSCRICRNLESDPVCAQCSVGGRNFEWRGLKKEATP